MCPTLLESVRKHWYAKIEKVKHFLKLIKLPKVSFSDNQKNFRQTIPLSQPLKVRLRDFRKIKTCPNQMTLKTKVVPYDQIRNFRSVSSKLWIPEHFEYWNFSNSESDNIFLHFQVHKTKSKLWDFWKWYSKNSNWVLFITLRRTFGEHLVIITYT